jgi:hypothetical protein
MWAGRCGGNRTRVRCGVAGLVGDSSAFQPSSFAAVMRRRNDGSLNEVNVDFTLDTVRKTTVPPRSAANRYDAVSRRLGRCKEALLSYHA